MHEKVGRSKEENKELIKKLIHKLHAGESPIEVKKEFKQVIKTFTPLEITQAEEQLVKEGMPPELIHHMCDVHLEALQEVLEDDVNLAPEGHPVNILMQEHAILLKYVNNLRDIYKELKDKRSYEDVVEQLKIIRDIVQHLKASESHYLREENVLFSYMEKHGVSQPPKIMWMEHDRVREIEKDLYALVDNLDNTEYSEFVQKFHLYAHGLAELIGSHFQKENRVLYPTAMQVCSEDEWVEMRKQFDDIGYCCFTPSRPEIAEKKEEAPQITEDNLVDLGTGRLTVEQLKMIFETLPVDITFVKKDDTVGFFSEGPDRVFARTTAIIGRLVENCHPDKSISRVLEIIEGFKDGTLDKADFWLNLGGRLIYIRYFPVRNKQGEYEGVLEVTQDLTEIKKIEGEKRLL